MKRKDKETFEAIRVKQMRKGLNKGRSFATCAIHIGVLREEYTFGTGLQFF
jgi:hypothetical protein